MLRRQCPLLVVLVLGGAGCVFDGAIPRSAAIACGEDDDCNAPARCQPATHLCVVDGFDPVAPQLEEVEVALLPPAGTINAAVAAAHEEFPLALARGGVLHLGLAATKTLRAPPRLDVEGPLVCELGGLLAGKYRFSCTVPEGDVPDAGSDAHFTATLIDVVGNTTTTTLTETIRVDTVAPPPVREDALSRRRAPWGTTAGSTPSDTVTVDADLGDDAFVVALTVDGQLRATLDVGHPTAEDVDVAGAATNATIEVVVVDDAGNVSPPTRVERDVFLATLNGKIPGRTDPNPHVVGAVGALGAGPLRRDRVEVAGLGADRAGSVPAVRATGTGAWRRASDPLPGVFGRALLLADPLRGRVLRFGGLVRQEVFLDLVGSSQLIGPALGVNDAWEWNGVGWSVLDDTDPEADDRPAGRVGAAGAVDVARGLTFIHGGNLANSDPAAVEVDDGAVLDDTWVWNGASWRRAATGGPAVRGAVALVDDVSGALIVAFGSLTSGASSGLTACAFRLARGAWSSACPAIDDVTAPAPRAFAAQALDHADGIAWLFGGDGAGGGVLDELLRLDGGGAITRIVPVDGVAPPARSHAAAAWDDRRRRLLIFGGVDDDGSVLSDLWSFDAATLRWTRVDATGAPSLTGLREPLLAWDDARDTLILQASELRPDLPPTPPFPARPQPPRARTILWHPARDRSPPQWEDRSDIVAPTPTFHPRLACGDDVGCVLFDDGALDHPLHLDAGGWRGDPTADPLIAALVDGAPHRPADLVVWDENERALVALAGNETFVFRPDEGWSQPFAGTPARSASSGLAATAAGIVLASTTSGKVHRFDLPAGVWSEVGSLPLASNRPDVVSGLQWLGVVGSDDAAVVHGLKITSPSPLTLCPGCDPLLIPTAITTVAQRWSVAATTIDVVGDAADPVGAFGGFSAVSASAADPEHHRALFFGGVGLASDRPTSLLLAQTEEADGATGVEVADVAGDGFPHGRVAAALARNGQDGSHVLVGGSTSVHDWGLFQARIIADLDADEAAVIAVGCFGDSACIDRRTADRLPRADLNDTWLLSFADEQPAFLIDFDLSALHADEAAAVAETRVILSAGGDGENHDGLPIAGVRVAVWNGTRFVDVEAAPGGNADGTAIGPAGFSVVLDDVVDVARLAREGAPVRLAVTPRGTNGGGAATVSLNDVALQVQLRR